MFSGVDNGPDCGSSRTDNGSQRCFGLTAEPLLRARKGWTQLLSSVHLQSPIKSPTSPPINTTSRTQKKILKPHQSRPIHHSKPRMSGVRTMEHLPHSHSQLLRLLSLQSARSSLPAKTEQPSLQLDRWANLQMVIANGSANDD